MKRLSAWVVDNGRWFFATAMVLVVAAGVFGATTPVTAALCAFGAVVLLVAGLMVAGLVSERTAGFEGDDADDAYFGAVAAGDPVSRRSRREIGRELALSSRRATAHAVVSAIARHYRRHPKGGAR